MIYKIKGELTVGFPTEQEAVDYRHVQLINQELNQECQGRDNLLTILRRAIDLFDINICEDSDENLLQLFLRAEQFGCKLLRLTSENVAKFLYFEMGVKSPESIEIYTKEGYIDSLFQEYYTLEELQRSKHIKFMILKMKDVLHSYPSPFGRAEYFYDLYNVRALKVKPRPILKGTFYTVDKRTYTTREEAIGPAKWLNIYHTLRDMEITDDDTGAYVEYLYDRLNIRIKGVEGKYATLIRLIEIKYIGFNSYIDFILEKCTYTPIGDISEHIQEQTGYMVDNMYKTACVYNTREPVERLSEIYALADEVESFSLDNKHDMAAHFYDNYPVVSEMLSKCEIIDIKD